MNLWLNLPDDESRFTMTCFKYNVIIRVQKKSAKSPFKLFSTKWSMNLLQCSKTKYNRLKTHLRFTTLYHHHLSRLLSFSACFILISTKVHSTKMIRCTLDLIYFTIRIVNQIVLSFQYFASVKKAQWKNIYSRVKKFNYV